MNKVRLIQGNEACALGALRAGCTFFAGYPITPSTEVAEYMAEWLPKEGGVFIQMEDEIASMGALLGAAAAGAKSFTSTSGPGFSLMQELIGYACMAELPSVIVNVQRAGPSTGLPTLAAQGDIQQTRWGTHGDHALIAVAPYSVTEIYYQTIRAFNLAEKYRTPVVILLDGEIGHLRERFDVDPDEPVTIIDRKAPVVAPAEYIPYTNKEPDLVPPMPAYGQGYRYHITGLTHNEKGFYSASPPVVDALIRRLNDKIELALDDIVEMEEHYVDDCDVLIIAYGSVARSAEEALEQLRGEGLSVGLLRPVTIWPFDARRIAEAAAGKKAVIVPEMNLGQYAKEIRAAAGNTPVYEINRVDSKLVYPEQIITLVKEVLA